MLNNDPMSPDEDFSTNLFNPSFQQGFMNPSSAMQVAADSNPSISLKTGLGYPISSLLGSIIKGLLTKLLRPTITTCFPVKDIL